MAPLPLLLLRGPTPIRLLLLGQLLDCYPNPPKAKYLLDEFSQGFRIPAPPPSQPTWAKNLRSVCSMEEVVRKKIAKEVVAGRVAGPFSEQPLHNLQVSSLGLVPKKVAGEFRLIHHLLYPKGQSANDQILHDFCSVKYMCPWCVTAVPPLSWPRLTFNQSFASCQSIPMTFAS